MIENKTQFYTGLGLMAGFIVVLIVFFSPVFGGQNGLNFLDNLYNSISKGSAYYIPKVKKEAEGYEGKAISVTIRMADQQQAEEVLKLFEAPNAGVSHSGPQLTIDGDLGLVLANCLSDADEMYYNRGESLSAKYGYDARRAMYNWWKALKETEKELKRQERFKDASIIDLTISKAVESAYNYYGIEPQKITDRLGIVIGSLLFYVIYTVWYGFAFMYMFQGWGMKLEH